jgi:hypothetical protein
LYEVAGPVNSPADRLSHLGLLIELAFSTARDLAAFGVHGRIAPRLSSPEQCGRDYSRSSPRARPPACFCAFGSARNDAGSFLKIHTGPAGYRQSVKPWHRCLRNKGEERTRILTLLDSVPTIVDIHLERATVIPDFARRSAALIADFGASDSVVPELVFGRFSPTGRLPFELPSSMEAVRAQKEDVPYDSVDPLFPFDFGMSYIDRVERGDAGSPEAS